MLEYHLDEFVFRPSKRKNKKYDVYKNGEYITSFRERNYQQFEDQIGHYSHLNHYDNKRRINFHKRFQTGLKLEPLSATWFSSNYLW